ncbi:MAG: hypothetical protein IKT93_04460 [Clostridia bacterium]|nr:hypothetical protein [Clostridia bacterium]
MNNQNSNELNLNDIEKLKSEGNTEKLINNLSPEQKEKLNAVLNDKEALEKVLKSPQALALMKLFGGGKNG